MSELSAIEYNVSAAPNSFVTEGLNEDFFFYATIVRQKQRETEEDGAFFSATINVFHTFS